MWRKQIRKLIAVDIVYPLSPSYMLRVCVLALLLLNHLDFVGSQSWTGIVAQSSSSQEISSSSVTDVYGLTLTVPTAETSDSVFMFVNINVSPTSSLNSVVFTIYRDNSDLALSNKVMVNVDHTELTLTQAATFTYVDVPPSVGSFEYKVRGRYQAIVSSNGQVRQIAALVVPSTIPTNKNTVFTTTTVSTTSFQSLGVDTAVTTNHVTDRVLVSTTFSLGKAAGAGMVARLSLFRNDVKVDANAMQLVHKFEGVASNRQVTIFFLDAPNTAGSVTYSIRGAKDADNTVSFFVGGGEQDMTHMSLMVVSNINSNFATAINSMLIVSTSWTEVGLSAAITPASIKDKVLITVNINFSPSVPEAIGAFTIFRDSTNLGDLTYGLQVINSLPGGGCSVASMTFLDSPYSDSSVTYTVKVKGLNANSYSISDSEQTRQIAVIATSAAACTTACTIAAGVLLQRVAIPTDFKLVFGITVPNVGTFSGTRSILMIKDSVTGAPLLSVERADVSHIKIVYNGADIAIGWPLISASVGGTTPTIYTISVIGSTISINNNNNGHTTPLGYNIGGVRATTADRLFFMYISSNGGETSSTGTISSIRIIGTFLSFLAYS